MNSHCELGHADHKRRKCKIVLDGETRVADYPPWPYDLRTSFEMEVFDYFEYESPDRGFCPGREGSYNGILHHGIWEGFESVLFASELALADGRGFPVVVLDFGASAGWYSLLSMMSVPSTRQSAAIQASRAVFAFEGDPETAALHADNMARNGVDRRVRTHHMWIDDKTPSLAKILPPEVDHISILKSDLEGSEESVVRSAKSLLEAGKVESLMLEISPCFKSGYDDMLEYLSDIGYTIASIPGKCRDPYRAAWSKDPHLEVYKRIIKRDRIRGWVSAINQENVFCWRGDNA